MDIYVNCHVIGNICKNKHKKTNKWYYNFLQVKNNVV